MKRNVALLALAAFAAFAQAGAWAATYTFTGPIYANLKDFTPPCAAGPCVNFTAAMRQTGQFTTNQPLLANQSGLDIAPFITSYFFNDGVTDYDSANGADTRLEKAMVNTDANGQIVDSNIVLLHWQTASHGAGDRLRYMAVNLASYANRPCVSLTSPDICHSYVDDGATSHAFAHGSGGWASDVPVLVGPGGVQSVPVDNPFALVLTAVSLVGLAMRWRSRALMKA